jgi:hypothetical protein
MEIFFCGCCSIKYPTLHRHVHHKKPRALGGKDTEDNLIEICPSCHDTIHAIAKRMMSKNVSPTQIIDSLALIYINNKKAQETCLELATNIRNAQIQAQEKGLGPNHMILIGTTLRQYYKPLIMNRATELNISQENYFRMLILQDLSKRFNINANLNEEVRLINYIKKEKKKKTFGRDESNENK